MQSIGAVPRMLRVIAGATGLRWVAVARVTASELTICAVHDELAFGFAPGAVLEITKTLCDKVRREQASIIIDNVATDSAYQGHPVPQLYGFQSYFSIPIHRKGGEFFGTLCGLDTAPARLSDAAMRESLELYAQLLSSQIDDRHSLSAAREALIEEQDISKMRERLIGILGHDLRTPLSAISACAGLVRLISEDERTLKAMSRINLSVERISMLIDSVMDFTRSKVGGALASNLEPHCQMQQVLAHVIEELRLAYPDRSITADLSLTDPISCDAMRIAQLASNLLVNALLHGDQQAPVRLEARTGHQRFTLAVSNSGDAIPAARLATLFDPFSKTDRKGKQGGLGLGLYIAAEIAKAHHGELGVESSAGKTVFTLTMPL
ncbi:GAF domain-containing sensor histidine kinase [Duganella aquatilis]|uniref:GAF domain-containing sensor histidine kinase n=1 Tax=Duganella aquatilis TaxID=2666082 RepID=UPI00140E6326